MKKVHFADNTNFDNFTLRCSSCKHLNIKPINRCYYKCVLCKKDYCQRCIYTLTLCKSCFITFTPLIE